MCFSGVCRDVSILGMGGKYPGKSEAKVPMLPSPFDFYKVVMSLLLSDHILL